MRHAMLRLALPLLLGAPLPALAIQPLEVFLEAAQKTHPQVLEARAVLRQRQAEASLATWRLLPSFSAAGSYSRNQYERRIRFSPTADEMAIMQINQLDAALRLHMPLLNVSAWEEKSTRSALKALARAQSEVTQLELQKRVAFAYYQLLAHAAVHRAARASLSFAEENAANVQVRHTHGAATALDVRRAVSEVARAEEDTAAAQLQEISARRSLLSLTGVQPLAPETFPKDALHPEAPLEAWLQATKGTPLIRAAEAASHSAHKRLQLAHAQWYPTLTLVAQQRFTNATALVGEEAYYSVHLNFAWRVNGTKLYQARAARAQLAAASARENMQRRDSTDAVFYMWHRIQSGLKRARAARKHAAAAAAAATIAGTQYQQGVTTQLEVLAARQAAFTAKVGRLQADAALAYARVALRILTARPIHARRP